MRRRTLLPSSRKLGGRRVAVTAPDRSLLLRKGAAEIPHGGGRKIEPDSYQYARLKRWIAEGAGFDDLASQSSPIVAIEVEPLQQSLLAGEAQQLRVTAVDGRGNRRCVTVEAEYESNAPSIADVNQRGLVEASDIPGEAAILVRYLGHVAVSRITLPRANIEFNGRRKRTSSTASSGTSCSGWGSNPANSRTTPLSRGEFISTRSARSLRPMKFVSFSRTAHRISERA